MMSHVLPTARCTCGEVHIGGQPTGFFNWNPNCGQHGTSSEWWNLPEQVAKRESDGHRLRVLQTKARHARHLGVGCSSGEVLEEEGECPVCDLTRYELDI